MFLLNILPDALIHALLVAGVIAVLATTFFSYLPIIGNYLKQIQVVAIVVLVLSVYLEGGLSEKKTVEVKTSKVEVQVAKKETAAAETTIKVVTKYVDRIKTVTEKGETIYVKVPEIITKYDSTCQLPNAFVLLYDSSNKAEVPDAIRDTDARTATSDRTSVTDENTTK